MNKQLYGIESWAHHLTYASAASAASRRGRWAGLNRQHEDQKAVWSFVEQANIEQAKQGLRVHFGRYLGRSGSSRHPSMTSRLRLLRPANVKQRQHQRPG